MKASGSPDVLHSRVRPPVAVALGSPREVALLVAGLDLGSATCFQMDLYQADRLRRELADHNVQAQVTVSADLWDLSAEFETVIYPAPAAGERSLKIDMVEQAYHVLRPGGTIVVLSPYVHDELFPALLKKTFGRVHASRVDSGTVLWCRREGDRPRRRHEVVFHARIGDGPSLTFVSRPGVFSYGRLDDGARALIETMHVQTGDRIVDIGCGCGAIGIFAAELSGLTGYVSFVDSNARAIALAELNARANHVPHFDAIASANAVGPPEATFDVALANPPYYAQLSIARLFIERSRSFLRPGGRLYLVTKQADQLIPLVADLFGPVEAVPRRGYAVLHACVRGNSGR
jgi:16S rRNA (guanine1207-N2)-methyltransferase